MGIIQSHRKTLGWIFFFSGLFILAGQVCRGELGRDGTQSKGQQAVL